MRGLVIGFLPVLTSYALAQAAPDASADVRSARLALGTDSLAVYFVRGTDTTQTGLIRDELTVLDSGGRRLLRRVYWTGDRVLGTRSDTIIDELANLRPVRVRSRAASGLEFLEFTAGRVAGWLRLPNGDSVAIADVVPTDVYYAGSFDLVLRSASLSPTWTASVPSYLTSARGVVPLTARVAGTEDVDGRDCWRVEAHFSNLPVTFWIDRETRALRRQAMQPRAGVQILFAAFRPAQKRAT